MLRYLVESSAPSLLPLTMLNFSDGDRGVSTGLHSCIPDRFKMSIAYLSWVRINPSRPLLTSVPKKKCRSPKSLRANSACKSVNSASVAREDELATIISST